MITPMKHYVFVGGTSGIGRTAAIALAREGAAILVVGRSAERGLATEQQLRAAGAPEARWLQADLTSRVGMDDALRGIHAWRDRLDGLVHSAMCLPSFRHKAATVDGLEHAFALQYLARVALNRGLLAQLTAGQGRIVHVGAKPPRRSRLVLDDLQFNRRRWSLMAALMSSQLLGFLHAQEAASRWSVPVSIACVGPTNTETITAQPLWLRALYSLIATTPERSARNVVRFLLEPKSYPGHATYSAARFEPQHARYDPQLARAAWDHTEALLSHPSHVTASGASTPATGA
ncbi:MAG: SDR family NAD(P)-dependent oxidoreductase [Polyangiales bacterium]